jgi:hypothetical protein
MKKICIEETLRARGLLSASDGDPKNLAEQTVALYAAIENLDLRRQLQEIVTKLPGLWETRPQPDSKPEEQADKTASKQFKNRRQAIEKKLKPVASQVMTEKKLTKEGVLMAVGLQAHVRASSGGR